MKPHPRRPHAKRAKDRKDHASGTPFHPSHSWHEVHFVFLLLTATGLLALENPGKKPPASPFSLKNAPVIRTAALVVGEDPRAFTKNPEGAGVAVEGTDEELRPFTTLTVTFPGEMVAPDKIDVVAAESPVVVWPAVDTGFTWSTPTQGYLTIKGPVIPAQTYRLRLREGLKDVAGAALAVDAWGAEMTSPSFQILEENYGQRSSLGARPQVPLEFNYPVRLADAAQGTWFQNRATRERFPAEILLNTAGGEMESARVVDGGLKDDEKISGLRVRPARPLPAGAFYDLVVEGVSDAYAGRGLAYPRVFPLGQTRPMAIEWVVARNRAMEPPSIEVKFDDSLAGGPLPKDAVSVSPAVPNLRFRKEGAYLTVDGDFRTEARYTVTVSDKIIGEGGFGLATAGKWGATFRPVPPSVLFPDRLLRQRSALGLRFAFYQVNTGALQWKLAAVPPDKLAAVITRNDEFNELVEDKDGKWVWTADGSIQHATTEEFIPAFGLHVVASGSVPASPGAKESLREISWTPPQPGALSGPMVLEVTGKDAQGRVIGNRALIYFGEAVITRKLTPTQTILRIARMSNGEPVAGAEVSVLDDKLQTIATGTSAAEGLAVFEQAAIAHAAFFLAEVDGAPTLQPVILSDPFSSGYTGARPPPALRAFTFTDRPLYRPGQEVSFKGMVREEKNGLLQVAAGKSVQWSIEPAYGGEVLARGETKVDAEGGWNGKWLPPAGGFIGPLGLRVTVDDVPLGLTAGFRVEEFRNPLFSVVCDEAKADKPAGAVVAVQSQYFHGAPNAGAAVKWTTTWTSDSDEGYSNGDGDMKRVDLYSEKAPRPTYSAEVSGETALDGNGKVILRCNAPFKDPGNRARCSVSWKVEVTGPDGQTITGGTNHQVDMLPVLLGVKADEQKIGKLTFQWDAETPFGDAPEAVNAQLFHVVTKSVKERLAPDVYRYRNFDQFIPVEKRERVKEETLTFKPKEPGRYVVVVSPLSGAAGMPVSEEAFLDGDEPSEIPVQSDSTATVFTIKGGRNPEDKAWKVGETAVINVLSPTGGVAWVSVESDHILDTFTVPIQGNTSRIEIPVKPEYEPNVFVSIYILRPGGDDQLAGEMFGYTNLDVVAPNRNLAIAVAVDRAEYEPREKITGTVRVTAAGQPVAGADLAISAVDDSLLELGGWQLPRFLADFFPARSFAVVTYSALKAYVDKIAPSWLTAKGFVIGDGGGDEFGNVTFARKEFQPLILWQPSVKTNAKGEATFSCAAPDNLTRFRVIAVGQTKASQFGAGDATFAVTKRLLIDPALPRFVRDGDEVELRAVARQKVTDQDKLVVRCTTGGTLQLLSDPKVEVGAAQDAPAVVRFKAKATGVGPATVKFEIASTSDPKLTDAVEVTLPVAQPVILKKESVTGTVGNTTFAVREVAPRGWENAKGTFSFAVSTTPWLAKLMGLPYLLEYPHGCFEQKTSRLLAITYLGGLLEYLPDAKVRRENYGQVVTETLKEIEASLLPGGMIPYWPGGTEPNDFVTIQAAWCVAEAEGAGFEVPERLSSELPETLEKIVTKKIRPEAGATLRAFALFVLAPFGEEPSDELKAAANELYLQRDKLTGEGKAMLAISLHGLKLWPEKQAQLIGELPKDFSDIAFNSNTFSSAARTEALSTWARLAVAPNDGSALLKERLNKLLESSSSLSTQENLWLLVAFDALLKSRPPTAVRSADPAPDDVSENKSAVAWTDQDLAKIADFVVKGLPAPKPPGSFVLSASYFSGERKTARESQGLRIERVVKNLSEPSRTGSEAAPFKLGDELLISYRFTAEKPQSFVAVEDLLPGGIEVVNPNLAMFGKHYSLPDEAGVTTLGVSHSEMRDQQTNLYFDHLPAGPASYSVLARATAAGTFIWPATRIQPMYDSRFFGRSPSGTCVVASE